MSYSIHLMTVVQIAMILLVDELMPYNYIDDLLSSFDHWCSCSVALFSTVSYYCAARVVTFLCHYFGGTMIAMFAFD